MIRKSANFVLKTALAAFFLLIAGTLVYLWFIDTPRSLDRFKPDIESALDEMIYPLRTEIGQLQITWSGWRQSPLIEVDQMQVFNEDTLLLTTGRIDVDFSFSDLLKGEVNPKTVVINKPVIDSRIISSYQSKQARDSSTSNTYDFLYGFLERLKSDLELSAIEISNGQFVNKNKNVLLPSINISVIRDKNYVQINSETEVVYNQKESKIGNRISYTKKDNPVQVDGYFNNINLSLIPELIPFPAVQDLQAEFDIDFSMQIDSVQIKELQFSAESAGGSYYYDGVTKDILRFTGFNLSGKGLNDLNEFRDINLNIQFDDLEVRATTSILKRREYPLIEANIIINDLTTGKIAKYWPQNLEQNTRRWIITNLSGASFTNFKAYLYLTPDVLKTGDLKDESLTLSFSFKNLNARYYSELPDIKNAVGEARLSGKFLNVDVANADFMDSKLVGSQVNIEGIGEETRNLIINTYLGGPLENISDALSGLGVFQDSTLKFKVIKGQAATQLSLNFPLGVPLEFNDYNVNARATINNADIENIYGYNLKKGRFDFSLISGQLQAKGRADINNVNFDVQWQQNVYNRNNPVLFNFTGNLSNSELARFGIPYFSGLNGKSEIKLNLQVIDSLLSFSGQADLTNNSFKLPYLGWTKNIADRATVNFQASKITTEDILLIDNFQLTHNTLFAKARADINLATPNTYEVFADTVIYLKNRFNGHMVATPPQNLSINLSGQAIDLREIIQNEIFSADTLEFNSGISITDKKESNQLINITLETEEAELLDNVYVTKLQGELKIAAGQITAMNFNGSLNDEPLELLFDPAPEINNMQIRTGDGGSFLKGFGIYKHITGGKLEFKGDVKTTLPKGPLTARMTIEDFYLRDAPTLTKMLSLAALLGESGLLKNEGIPFRTMEIDLQMQNNIITVRDSKMAGGALILSGQGTLNLNNETIDLSGVLYPFTQVNSLLSRIPLIGKITDNVLILGTSYDLNGNYKDANVKVKPLSILLPAFVRDFGDFLFKGKSDSLLTQ